MKSNSRISFVVAASLTVLAAFVLPSLVAFLRNRWARRRRGPDR